MHGHDLGLGCRGYWRRSSGGRGEGASRAGCEGAIERDGSQWGKGEPDAVRGGLVVLLRSGSARLPQGYEWSAVRKELPLIRDGKLLQYKGGGGGVEF